MHVARILYPVKSLGPGKRIGIWFSGCHHGCIGCSNPELWEQKEEQYISIENLMKLINLLSNENEIEGFTITGGEPFLNPYDLSNLINEIKNISKDILLYTGYELSYLKKKNNPYIDDILKNISVLIDGKYIDKLNKGDKLKGSENQNIYIFNKNYFEKYEMYLNENSSYIQNFYTDTGIISAGIHKPNFNEDFSKLIIDGGLLEYNG